MKNILDNYFPSLDKEGDGYKKFRNFSTDMTLRSYLVIMIIATLVCWLAWIFTLWTVNPDTTNWLGFSLFYLSLFLALSGTAAIMGFIIRFVTLKHELAFRAVKTAFRQSFIFAFLITASLFLLARDLFTWLNLFLLVVGLSVLEYFLISHKKPHTSHHPINSEESHLDK